MEIISKIGLNNKYVLRLGKCLTENYVTNLQCENVTMKKKITISQLQLKIYTAGMKRSIKRASVNSNH